MLSSPSVQKGAVGLLDHNGRSFLTPKAPLHALDDPDVWRKSPAYEPPADIDIEREQRWIDSIMGTQRGESTVKLVWSGDRSYWYEFFMRCDPYGRPIDPPVRRPRVRHKVIRDEKLKMLRDVFPPRWLLLSRLEREQYADTWKRESWVWDDKINTHRLIRPEEPPEVFWMWFATIAKHGDFCCATAEKNKHLCYGKYVPPSFARELLENQRATDKMAGKRSPFDKVDASFISEIEDEYNGYSEEMAALEIESEIFIENPMALLGIAGSEMAGIDTVKQARQIVTDHYKREIDERSKLI